MSDDLRPPVIGVYGLSSGGEVVLEGTTAAVDGFERKFYGIDADPSSRTIKVQILPDVARDGSLVSPPPLVEETYFYEFDTKIYRKVIFKTGSSAGEFYYEQVASFSEVLDPISFKFQPYWNTTLYGDAFYKVYGLQATFTVEAPRETQDRIYTDEYFVGVSSSRSEYDGAVLSGRYIVRFGYELGDFTINGADSRYHVWGDDWLGLVGEPQTGVGTPTPTPPPTPTPTPAPGDLPDSAQPVLQSEPTPEPLHDTYLSRPFQMNPTTGAWSQNGVALPSVPNGFRGLMLSLGWTYFDDVKASLTAMREAAGAAVDQVLGKLETPGLKSMVNAFKADEADSVVMIAEMLEGSRDPSGFAQVEANLEARRLAFRSGAGLLLNSLSAVTTLFGRTSTVISHSDVIYRLDVDLRTEKPLLQLANGHQDVFLGSWSVDQVDGGDQNDALIGYAGNDRLFGNDGNDLLSGDSGDDYLRGDNGDDRIVGGEGFDDINGNMGADTAAGGIGGDWVVGGKDNDSLNGDSGDDIVYGNLGDDTCEGGAGDDIVRGGQGDDLVRGGSGDDYVSGDRGADTVTGGSGADVFHSFGDNGLDRVLDFSRAEGDRVQLDLGTTYSVAQVGADTVITMNGGGQMVLVGVSMTSLTGAWIFVG